MSAKPEKPGLKAAMEVKSALKGPPSEHDAPRMTPFAGPKPKILPGQLSLDDLPAASPHP